MSVGVYFPRTAFALRSDVRLVEVLAVVRDRQGHPVAGLRQGQFQIKDAGKKREITAFSVLTTAPNAPTATATPHQPYVAAPSAQEALPRFVGIVFDDLNTGFREFRRTQVAARKFVRTGLAPGDRVALFSTYGQQLLPFTADVDTLTAAIDKLRARSEPYNGSMCPKLSAYESYLIANDMDSNALVIKIAEAERCHPTLSPNMARGGISARLNSGMPDPRDATVQFVKNQAAMNWSEVRAHSLNTLSSIQAIADYMGRLPGTRMMLLASGGFLSGNLITERDTLIAHALRAGVVINSLDAKGLYTLDMEMPPGGDARFLALQLRTLSREMVESNDALAGLAASTGGRFFSNGNDLAADFEQLGARPEVAYLLGFVPKPQPNGLYHKLEVRLTAGANHSLQARPGYFATREEPGAPQAERRIDRELLSATISSEVPASITTKVAKQDGEKVALTATLHLDVNQLAFLHRGGVRAQKLNILIALLDEQGAFVAGKEGTMTLTLGDATFSRIAAQGMGADFAFSPPPGKYRLRGLVEEANQGKFTAINQNVEIP